jgi:hypothetical protein
MYFKSNMPERGPHPRRAFNAYYAIRNNPPPINAFDFDADIQGLSPYNNYQRNYIRSVFVRTLISLLLLIIFIYVLSIVALKALKLKLAYNIICTI